MKGVFARKHHRYQKVLFESALLETLKKRDGASYIFWYTRTKYLSLSHGPETHLQRYTVLSGSEEWLSKNGPAGISSKNKNDPRLENELRTVSPHANNVRYENDFFGGIADFETTPLQRVETIQPLPRPGAHRMRVQHRYRVPCTRYKLRYVTRRRIENNKEFGWSRKTWERSRLGPST